MLKPTSEEVDRSTTSLYPVSVIHWHIIPVEENVLGHAKVKTIDAVVGVTEMRLAESVDHKHVAVHDFMIIVVISCNDTA